MLKSSRLESRKKKNRLALGVDRRIKLVIRTNHEIAKIDSHEQ